MLLWSGKVVFTMTEKELARINELARLAKERALDSEEEAERAELRQKYIQLSKQNLQSQLDRVRIQNQQGDAFEPLKKKD